MTNTTTRPASDKQRDFIAKLITERVLDDAERARIETALAYDTLDVAAASETIGALLKAPRRSAATKNPAGQALLARIPKSRYAIGEAELSGSSVEVNNDLLFIEVREYRGTLYMRRLHGAPGSFTRTKLSAEQVKDIVDIVATDPYKYARLFGEHHTCCGSCGAELTDERSRELKLGPECRKKFGL
jgi:hypothetical protein